MDKPTEEMLKKAAKALGEKYKEAETGVQSFGSSLLKSLGQGLHSILTPPEYQTRYEEKLKQASEYPDITNLSTEERRRAALFGGNPAEQIKAAREAKQELSKLDPDYNYTSATGKHQTSILPTKIVVPVETPEDIGTNIHAGYQFGATELKPTKSGFTSPMTLINPYLGPEQKTYTRTHEMTHPFNIVSPKKTPDANSTYDEREAAKADFDIRNEFAPRIGLPIKLFLGAVHGKAGTTEEELYNQIKKLDENQIGFLIGHMIDKYNTHKPAQKYEQTISTPEMIKLRDESLKRSGAPHDANLYYLPDAGEREEQLYYNIKDFIDRLRAKDPTALKMLKSVSKVEKPDFNKTIA